MAERYEIREERAREQNEHEHRIRRLEQDFYRLLEAVELLVKAIDRGVVPVVKSVELVQLSPE